ncbi:MAG: hypothetical protein ACLFUJ_00535 [Phycisphaerae bacterium]
MILRSRRFSLVLLTAAVLHLAGAQTLAQHDQDDSDTPPSPRLLVPTTPASQPGQKQDLRLLKPSTPVTLPRTGLSEAPRKARLPLPGQSLSRMHATVGRDEQGFTTLTFLSDRPDRVPETVRLLPSATAEAIEQASDAHQQEFFRLAGELTVWKGNVYILVTRAVMVQPGQIPTRSAEQKPQPEPEDDPDSPTGDDAEDDGQGVEAEAIIQELFSEGKVTPMVSSDQTEPAQPLTENRETALPVIKKGELVINRAVRIRAVDDFWYEVRFVGDNNLQETPLKLLPSRLIDRALQLTTPPLRTETLLISGELTRYRGQTFLLLRKVLPQRDLGT